MGLLEVHGLATAIGAVDAMRKAAPVDVHPLQRIGDGLVTLVAIGDIAAVREAVQVGADRASGIGRVVATHVIGRPSPDLDHVFQLSGPAVGPRR